jgi:hypothetical protein
MSNLVGVQGGIAFTTKDLGSTGSSFKWPRLLRSHHGCTVRTAWPLGTRHKISYEAKVALCDVAESVFNQKTPFFFHFTDGDLKRGLSSGWHAHVYTFHGNCYVKMAGKRYSWAAFCVISPIFKWICKIVDAFKTDVLNPVLMVKFTEFAFPTQRVIMMLRKLRYGGLTAEGVMGLHAFILRTCTFPVDLLKRTRAEVWQAVLKYVTENPLHEDVGNLVKDYIPVHRKIADWISLEEGENGYPFFVMD